MDVDVDVLYGDCREGEEEVVGGNVPLAFCLAGDVIVRPDKEERPSFVDRPPWRPPRFREPTLSLTTPRFSVSIGGIGDHGLRSSSLRNDDDRVSSRSAFARRILEGRFGSRKRRVRVQVPVSRTTCIAAGSFEAYHLLLRGYVAPSVSLSLFLSLRLFNAL